MHVQNSGTFSAAYNDVATTYRQRNYSVIWCRTTWLGRSRNVQARARYTYPVMVRFWCVVTRYDSSCYVVVSWNLPSHCTLHNVVPRCVTWCNVISHVILRCATVKYDVLLCKCVVVLIWNVVWSVAPIIIDVTCQLKHINISISPYCPSNHHLELSRQPSPSCLTLHFSGHLDRSAHHHVSLLLPLWRIFSFSACCADSDCDCEPKSIWRHMSLGLYTPNMTRGCCVTTAKNNVAQRRATWGQQDYNVALLRQSVTQRK